MNQRIAILTGDVVNSTQTEVIWLNTLKETLKSNSKNSNNWQIYRGDSFQICTTIGDSLRLTYKIRSILKQFKNCDARIGIGIGTVNFDPVKNKVPITMLQGDAFVKSGKSFDSLKKQKIIINSGDSEKDQTLNLMIDLYELTIERWTANDAEMIYTALINTKIKQIDLAKKLKKAQGNLSKRITITGLEELKVMLSYFTDAYGK